MRHSVRVHPLRVVALGVLASLIVAGCKSTSRTSRYVQEPIAFYWIQFPDSVVANRVDSLTVLAQAGYGSCEVERLVVELTGDSLSFAGMARCRVGTDPAPPGVWQPQTPPAEANVVLLRVVLPALQAGTYHVLLADPLAITGALADTLVVSSNAPVTRDMRLVGFGSLVTVTDPACPAFTVGYLPGAVAGFPIAYLIDGLAAPPFVFRAGVLGRVLGPATCSSGWAGILQLRQAVPIFPPDKLR